MSLPARKTTNLQPRQIRFVSTDGQPQTKRRRIIAACRTCRKRKIRCSGEQPVCKTCADCGHKCLGYEPANRQPTPTSIPRDVQPDQKKIGEKGPGPPTSHQEKTVDTTQPAGSVSESESHGAQTASSEPRKDSLDVKSISSLDSNRSTLLPTPRTHLPYFRYFGPTAIVPGFKQMVVQVRETRKNNPSLSNDSVSSVKNQDLQITGGVAATIGDSEGSNSIHFYDPDDTLPNSEVVTHLCQIFFTHLGCNFPFLQRERFLHDLAEKNLEPILVDAVCALAARFSLHPLLSSESIDKASYPHHGDVFAHRAMCAVVDALPCPTIAVVQACLLLAYEEFGSNHDSGLWMYLGISIRMAQDLGIQKLEGMQYRYGQAGLTPKEIQPGSQTSTTLDEAEDNTQPDYSNEDESIKIERAKERERVDLFWSIFFLDRVISSGTGRPVTLRDDDIELHFPLESELILDNGWPSPFPPLMRIIHLYGRVTDLLNSIQKVDHVTPDILRRLAGMESDLTGIYQKLSSKLHFNAINFQSYVKSGEGTNFILLHFWFHTLIVILHQPTLLHTFNRSIRQLFPNSRELSMSSAKTIADILAFSELIDAKSFIGNPFTSQPIYIAACAFLMERAYYSLPSSGTATPRPTEGSTNPTLNISIATDDTTAPPDHNSAAKHSLLAVAAKDNYQRCYKALESLHKYWGGIKYILVALDQKSKGIWDPILYTEEQLDSSTERIPVVSSMTTPSAWKSIPTQDEGGRSEPHTLSDSLKQQQEHSNLPKIGSRQAIGWSLTGETNSIQPHLSFLYQLPTTSTNVTTPDPSSYQYQPPYSSNRFRDIASPSISQRLAPQAADGHHQNLTSPSTISHPDYLSPSNTTYPINSPLPPNISPHDTNSQNIQPAAFEGMTPYFTYNSQVAMTPQHPTLAGYGDVTSNTGGMMIESQDIDMNAFQNQASFPFSVDGEFMPWLEYLPGDVLSYFGDQNGG